MDPWHFVDAAYAITLETAVHRHKRLEDEIQRVKLAPKTEIVKVKKHPEGGAKGCYESHQNVWKDALQKGHQVVLIVEDDVFFSEDWEALLPHVADFLASGQPWDCFVLGWVPFRAKRFSSHVSHLLRGTATHAYLVSRAALEKGLPPFTTLPVDIELFFGGTNKAPKFEKKFRLKHNPWTNFVLRPQIAFQRYDKTTSTGNSDIANQFKERVGVMRFVGNIAEFVDVPCCVRFSCFLGLTLIFLVILLVLLVVMKTKQNSL